MWQLIFTTISAVVFFGFVIFGVRKFGLLSCYSAYAPQWCEKSPVKGLNVWSIITIITALLLMPVLLSLGEEKTWQFTGFIMPACLAFVGLTPDYGRGDVGLRVHLFCATLAADMAILFVVFITPKLFWLIFLYLALAGIATILCGKNTWNFWYEMAAYLLVYTAVYIAL